MVLLLPVYIGHLMWRGLKTPAYWQRWAERFGNYPEFKPAEKTHNSIWIHAVSVGEVQASLPVIRKLKEDYPDYQMLVTTTTPTGSRRVREILDQDVQHVYVPYDLGFIVNRFLEHFKPKLAMIMETEIWPNIFHACQQRSIPLILANARMSEGSAKGYRRFPRFIHQVLSWCSKIAVQSRQDMDRLIAIGADENKLIITGSVKIDVKVPASLIEQGEALRREWGSERTIWLAASTHEGEESVILDVFDTIHQLDPHLLLVLVPRHPERFAKVAAYCKKRGKQVVMRSEHIPCDASTDVYIGDSMGELQLFYAASDIAFVGGSLIPHGGQNMLEPAALGKPIVFGPSTFNFSEISRQLLDGGAAMQVRDAGELASVMEQLLRDANLRTSIGDNGLKMVEKNRGATGRLMDIVHGLME
ncbi:MAG: lipid IV(A) 3-deoxy-D-manno-octulosonic acid transferase [Gammaproteobacteria bacterium]|nr:MAG: lipid IV(A) 3-deoxy-D-manno-octulosonic acid transferase [Gammaproteobacteria bacterium]